MFENNSKKGCRKLKRWQKNEKKLELKDMQNLILVIEKGLELTSRGRKYKISQKTKQEAIKKLENMKSLYVSQKSNTEEIQPPGHDRNLVTKKNLKNLKL